MVDEYGLYVKTATGTEEILKPGIDRRVTALETGQAAQDKKFLPLAGGTMTGMLTLESAPTANLHAATKAYVDTTVSTATANAAFPSGTRMLFHQAAAPVGWVKDASVDDAALRIVSGDTGGSSSGSTPFSELFDAGKAVTLSGTVGATTLSTGQMPGHTHSGSLTQAGLKGYFSTNSEYGTYAITSSGSAGGGQSHTHSLEGGTASVTLGVKYTDIIICAKE